MGQKVNPVGLRIGVNKNWSSRWYANDNEFHVFLNEDIKVQAEGGSTVEKTKKGSTKYCPQCGKENKAKSEFCSECGAKL